jgi:hypothetical protein
VSENPFAQLLYGLTLVFAGLGTVVVAVVGGGLVLRYLGQVLVALAGVGTMPPMGDAVTALASVLAFVFVLAVAAMLEAGDGDRSPETSASSEQCHVDREQAGESLDRIEQSLEE